MKENMLATPLPATLPLVLERSRVGKLTGGMVNPKPLADLDSQGKGPERFRAGGQTLAGEPVGHGQART